MGQLFVVSATLALAATSQQGKPEATVAGVTEVRSTGQTASEQPSEGLHVLLRVSGLEDRLLHWKVAVTEAKDDVGADLAPSKQEELKSTRSSLGVGEQRPPFQVNLNVPSRQARRIASLEGELHLTVGGESAVVEAAEIKSQRGKTITHPELDELGITVQVAEQGKPAPQELVVMVSGQRALDASLVVVGADGSQVSTMGIGSNGESTQVWKLQLERPLHEQDALRMRFDAAGRETITVPFEFNDIALP